MKIAITGHRPNKLGNDYNLTSELIYKIKNKIEKVLSKENPTLLISGMALGIDTLFAKIAIKNKIPLLAAIPCANQDSQWPTLSRNRYRNIITHENTTRIFVSGDPYTPWYMQKRNEYMVDQCDLLIAVWDGSSGGTQNCIRYAEKVGRRIVYIDPTKL